MMTKDARLTLPPTIVDINVDMERMSFGYDGVVPVLCLLYTSRCV